MKQALKGQSVNLCSELNDERKKSIASSRLADEQDSFVIVRMGEVHEWRKSHVDGNPQPSPLDILSTLIVTFTFFACPNRTTGRYAASNL